MAKYILGLFEDYKLGLLTLERVWEIIEEELVNYERQKEPLEV